MKSSPFVFISYCRQDNAAASRWLYQAIQCNYGLTSVFMDTETICAGRWGSSIGKALRSATVLIAVIGSSWLRIADEDGRRRIDDEEDWVRQEISWALKHRLIVIPILLKESARTRLSALPACLQGLVKQQTLMFRDESWKEDLERLLFKLDNLGFRRNNGPVPRMPVPRITLKELSSGEIKRVQRSGWELLVSDIPGRAPLQQSELTKAFEFASFEDAMEFMQAAARHVSQVQHHPRWENVWRTVIVRLSTWDIGFKPSRLDIELSQFLEKLKKSLPAAQKGGSSRLLRKRKAV